MSEQSNKEKELKQALIKDFRALYVTAFTGDWKIQRIIRDAEITVMDLDNLDNLITTTQIKMLDRLITATETYVTPGDMGEHYTVHAVPARVLRAQKSILEGKLK